ncbi:MAG: helix-turn-helix domain-containing protein [Verrucomicrobiota bacterium]|nr:helix-turn-helix domain-containing protein [Verrucomicrobiota bacterium]
MKNKCQIKEIDFEVAIPNAERTSIVERVTVRVPVTLDSTTGEEILTPEALDLIEDTQARYMGLLLPGEIRALRKSLGLTQVAFGELLQVGEKTATRWETGRGRPSRSLNVLLCALRDGKIPTRYLAGLQYSTERPEVAADHQDLALAA